MNKQMPYIKPFLLLLNILPEKIYNVGKLLQSYTSSKNRQIIFATHKADVFEDALDKLNKE